MLFAGQVRLGMRGWQRRLGMNSLISRRMFLGGLKNAGAGAALARFSLSFAAYAQGVVNLPFANGERPLVRYPGKRPLIRQTSRPPQLETPFSVFNEGAITPNDAERRLA